MTLNMMMMSQSAVHFVDFKTVHMQPSVVNVILNGLSVDIHFLCFYLNSILALNGKKQNYFASDVFDALMKQHKYNFTNIN